MPRLPADRRSALTKGALVTVAVLAVAGTVAALLVPKATLSTNKASPPMAVSSATALAKAGEGCRELEAKYPNRELAEAATGPCKLAVKTQPACHSDARGAWRLFVQNIDADPATFKREGCESATVASAVVLLRMTGAEEASETFTVTEGRREGGDFTIVATFDYDGDGIDEVVLKKNSWQTEGCGTTTHDVLTARDGQVLPYAGAPKDVAGVEDTDGDGRPDLIVRAYAETHTNCISGEECQAGGISLVAHSASNGTFSMKDGVATAYAKKLCPKPQTVFRDKGDIACARMWGMGEETVLAKAKCKTFHDPDPCSPDGADHEERPGACPGIFARWAHQEPPLLLK